MRDFYRLAYRFNIFLHKIGFATIPLVSKIYVFLKNLLFTKDASMPVQYIISKIGNDQFYIPRILINDYIVREFDGSVKHVLRNNLRPGAVLVDVGANIGVLTVFASRLVGTSGALYAIEPGSDNLTFLHKNILINNIRNVTVLPCAAGSRAGSRNFYQGPYGTRHSFYLDNEKDDVAVNKVRELPLDEIIKVKVDFVKIDVEGAEIDVLNGMKTIMKENPDLKIIVEWNPSSLRRAGYAPADLPATLFDAQFQLSVIEDGICLHDLQEVSEYLITHLKDEGWYVNLFAWKTAGSERCGGRQLDEVPSCGRGQS